MQYLQKINFIHETAKFDHHSTEILTLAKFLGYTYIQFIEASIYHIYVTRPAKINHVSANYT